MPTDPDETRAPTGAEVLAALAYGERRAGDRADAVIVLAPDERARLEQRSIAGRERENARLIEARLQELGGESLQDAYAPYFDAFFERTEPSDWLEAQTFQYVADALTSDFADALSGLLDRVSSLIVRRTLGDRQHQEAFALDELNRGLEREPEARERIAAYARRVIGEALTQTGRALRATGALRGLVGEEDEKRLLLSLLEAHRERLDRLGIEPVEAD